MNGIEFHFTIHYKFSCFGLGLTSLSISFHNIMKIMDFCSKRVLRFANLFQTILEKSVHVCPKLLVILKGQFLVNLRQTGVSKKYHVQEKPLS